MNKRHVFGHVLLSGAMVSLGASFVAAKSVVGVFPNALALELRLSVACLVIVPLAMIVHRGPTLLMKGHGRALAVQAVVGVVLSNLFVLQALKGGAAIATGVSFGLLPVAIVLLSGIFLHEPISRSRRYAVAFAAAGAALLMIGGTSPRILRPDEASNGLLALSAVACSAAFVILSKHLSGRLPPLILSAGVSVIGLIILLPFAVREAQGFDFAEVPWQHWVGLASWTAAAGIAYPLMLYAGLSRSHASDAGVFTVAVPLSTLVLSHLWLDEAVTLIHMIGGLCAVLSVLILSGRRSSLGLPHPAHAA